MDQNTTLMRNEKHAYLVARRVVPYHNVLTATDSYFPEYEVFTLPLPPFRVLTFPCFD